MRLRLGCVLVLALVSSAVAQAKPKVVDIPLKTSGNVPNQVGQDLGKKFRKVIAASADVAGPDAAKKAMNTLNLPKACETLVCAKKLSEQTKRRFVLYTALSNEDDTYSVSLKLYDQSRNGFVAEVKKECEFCAAKEVVGTFKGAWKEVLPALKKEAATPKAPEPSKVSILTIPPGASIKLDGKELAEKTPHDVKLKAGEHQIEVNLEGYVTAKRTVTVKSGPTLFPIIELLKTSDLAVDTAPVPPNKTSSIYGLSLGMLVTGAILTGTGAWLTMKDGELTCRDGRDRRTCPEVYNTKYLGLTAGGIGGIMMGASAALLIKDYLDTKASEEEVSVQAGVSDEGVSLGVLGAF
ncbi:MAG: PEGA domain-containing protein [Bradymonadia bacterium]